MAEVYAFAWIAEQVGGDRVTVSQIIPTGADVHHYELSPQQVSQMSETGLVLYSQAVATAVDEGVQTAQPARVVNAADHIDLRSTATEEHDHADAEGHDHDEEAVAPAEDAHDHGGIDSHTWLAIDQLPAVVTAVATALSEADPAGAETYAANAAGVNDDLAALDAEYRDGLAGCERDTVVVTHPAFGYITDAYGLRQVGMSGFDEDTEPSPARLTEVGEIAQETGATTIYLANTSSPKIADVLAAELDLDTAVLDTITGASEAGDYLSASRSNLVALQAGLGCS